MKKTILAFAALIIFFNVLSGQTIDFNDYHILKSTGTLPLDLSSYVQDDLSNLSTDNKTKRAKKDEKDFILESATSLDKLLRSGYVIFNDPVGDYLTKILKTILEANGIDEEITVFFIRSSEVNAYAVDRNFIFFTAGLLAQVTTEAQIAMILSHEYIHYKNKHNRTEFIENKAIVRDYKSYKTSANDVRFLMTSFSRELETEADEQGFALYSATNYNYNGSLEAFDVLRFSYLPFEEISYEKTFLESPDLVFPSDYFLTEIAPIEYNIEENENESEQKYRTHPYIGKRKVVIQQLMEGTNNTGRKDFLVSETDFLIYRKVARYELCRLLLIENYYEEAFYSAYILLKEEPNSLFLKKIILKSLYGLSKYSNANKFSQVHTSHKKKQGESQQVYFFLDKLTKKEINYTAIHYAWRLYEQNKEDGDISYILKDLIYDACKHNTLTPYSLKTEHLDTNQIVLNTNDSTKVLDTSKTNKGNKYSKINIVNNDNKTNNSTKKKKNYFIDYAFVDILKNDEFKGLLKDQYKKWEDDETAKEDALKNKRKSTKYSDDEIDEARNIEGMLVLNPVILKVDLRQDERKLYYATKHKREEMVNNLEKLTAKTGITTTLLSTAAVTDQDADFLNDISLDSLLNLMVTSVNASNSAISFASCRCSSTKNRVVALATLSLLTLSSRKSSSSIRLLCSSNVDKESKTTLNGGGEFFAGIANVDSVKNGV